MSIDRMIGLLSQSIENEFGAPAADVQCKDVRHSSR